MSRNGTATFSATVRDEKSAPSWKSTPKRRRRAFSSCGSACQTSTSSNWMLPAVGRTKPIISRISTDLPLPLPPMSAITSPRPTLKLTPLCTTCAPKRVTTESTLRIDCISDLQMLENDGEGGVQHDHPHDALNDSGRGVLANAARIT